MPIHIHCLPCSLSWEADLCSLHKPPLWLASCCMRPVGGTGRALEDERREKSGHFLPTPSLLQCPVLAIACAFMSIAYARSPPAYSPRASKGWIQLLVWASHFPLSFLISAHTSVSGTYTEVSSSDCLGWAVSRGTGTDATLTTAINSELTRSKTFCHTVSFWHCYHYHHSYFLWLSYKRR